MVQWKMGPKSRYLSNIAIIHVHDYARKSMYSRWFSCRISEPSTLRRYGFVQFRDENKTQIWQQPNGLLLNGWMKLEGNLWNKNAKVFQERMKYVQSFRLWWLCVWEKQWQIPFQHNLWCFFVAKKNERNMFLVNQPRNISFPNKNFES